MSNKRLSRKRLFTMEKEGKDVDVGASTLMKGCISSATQHRQGYQVITDIVVDLASSKQTLISGGDASVENDIIGAGSSAAYVAKLDSSVFGTITKVETICLEKFVGSAGVLTGTNSIKLAAGDATNGVLNSAANNQQVVKNDIGDEAGKHELAEYNDGSLDGQHVYFVLGSAVNANPANNTVDTATATITVGSAETDEIDIADVFEDEVSRILLTKEDGTYEPQVFDLNGNDFDGAQAAGKISIKSATTAAEIAQGIATAFNLGSSAFTATQEVSPNSHVVTVTQTAAGAGGNQSNFFENGPGKTGPITITNFTGGTTKGDASPVTAGKFLLRFTGFVEPEDI